MFLVELLELIQHILCLVYETTPTILYWARTTYKILNAAECLIDILAKSYDWFMSINKELDINEKLIWFLDSE